MWFQHVDEPKVAKNRLHLDIVVAADERGPLVSTLVDLGGTVTANYPRFTVMTDPEGNELCLTEG